MAVDINGKTALVTGAGSGICLVFAQQLLQQGCNVVIADLGLQPAAEETIKQYTTGKPKAIFVKTDVTDWTQLQTVFDGTIAEFGSLDVVCPGPGIFEPPSSTFWNFPSPIDTAAASSYRTLDINLQSPIRCTQLAIDFFIRQGHKHGVVVLISSSAAQAAAPPIPLYAVSKAADATHEGVEVVNPKGVRMGEVVEALREHVKGCEVCDRWMHAVADECRWQCHGSYKVECLRSNATGPEMLQALRKC